MIVEFHHLGTLAQARGITDEADEWLRVAMEYREEMGDVRGMGVEARAVGSGSPRAGGSGPGLSTGTIRLASPLENVRGRCCGRRETYGQLGMVEEQRGNLPDALEWVARTYQLVRRPPTAHDGAGEGAPGAAQRADGRRTLCAVVAGTTPERKTAGGPGRGRQRGILSFRLAWMDRMDGII